MPSVDLFRKYLNRVAPLVDRIFLLSFGFNWIHYKGRPARTKDAPVLVVAPHSSVLDVFVIALHGVPSFVARDDVRNIRLLGCKSRSELAVEGAELLATGVGFSPSSRLCFVPDLVLCGIELLWM